MESKLIIKINIKYFKVSSLKIEKKPKVIKNNKRGILFPDITIATRKVVNNNINRNGKETDVKETDNDIDVKDTDVKETDNDTDVKDTDFKENNNKKI